MNYRSVADLAATIRTNLHKIPPEIDLIVGIPRSGLLAATLLGLSRNLPVVDLNSFIADREIYAGSRYATASRVITRPSEALNPLIIDDSVSSGEALNRAKERLKEVAGQRRLRFAVVYAAPNNTSMVDIYLEIVRYPRMFEWNALHHYIIKNVAWILTVSCVLTRLPNKTTMVRFISNFSSTRKGSLCLPSPFFAW
jgi:hypoxanthine phosphoribosyltransferase